MADAIGKDPKIGQTAAFEAEAEEAIYNSTIDTMKNDVNNKLIKNELSKIKSDVQNINY